MQDRDGVRKITLLAAFSAVAIILGYVESLIPLNFGIPGVKLGLANLAVVVMLFCDNYGFDFKDVLIVSLVRIVVVGLLFGNMYGIIYSLCGGLISLCAMFLLKRIRVLGVLSVSIAGGVMHNLGQLFVAMIVVEQLKIIYYAPVLLLSGSICGALIGIIGGLIAARLNKIKIN